MRQSREGNLPGDTRLLSGLCISEVVAVLCLFCSFGQAAPPPFSTNPFLKEGVADTGWPFVRGANFNGHSNEIHLADTWPSTGPPVLWTCPLGQGYSGFIAWNDRVATQFQTLAGQYVVCLDADTGKEIWRHWYEWPYEPAGVYPGPRATPTYSDGQIYFASPNGLIGCLDARTGTQKWKVNIYDRFGSQGTGFGYSCSPTVIAGKVVLPVGGKGASMVALDAANGSLVWKAGDDAASYTPAYPLSIRNRQVVLGYLQNALVCHDLATGEQLWRYVLSGGYDEHSAWPIYLEPHLWISSPFQAGSELLELTDRPTQPVKIVRKSDLMSNDIFSSVLVDGAIYGFDLREAQAKVHRPSRGVFRCLDFITGNEHWSNGDSVLPRSELPSAESRKRIGHATVIVADRKLILLNDTGELILASATTQHYEELGRASILSGEICWTQPALHRGRLFVRNQSRAACVYLGKLELLAPQTRQAALTTADIPQSRYLDLAGVLLGVEPQYAFDIPSNQWLWQWFVISLGGIMGLSSLVVAVFRIPFAGKLSASATRWSFWVLVYVLGAIGTTVLSKWFDDFVFTWPVAIFVAFQAAVWETTSRVTRRPSAMTWRAPLVMLGFAGSCLIYFLLCRRLSLVFEWVFLCGFIGALPLSIAGKTLFQQRRWSWLWEVAMTAASFTAFYWTAVVVLWIRRG